jgi:hypothetical protein
MPPDRIDPIEPLLPGAIAPVRTVLRPAEREAERRRREDARERRRRRDEAADDGVGPFLDEDGRPHVDVRG